jgi:hypothetical protein
VNRKVDLTCQERPLDLLRENTTRADLSDRSRSVDVAASRDFHDLNRMAKVT